MAHTTEVDSWDYDDDYDDNADALEEMEVASLQELYDKHETLGGREVAHTTRAVSSLKYTRFLDPADYAKIVPAPEPGSLRHTLGILVGRGREPIYFTKVFTKVRLDWDRYMVFCLVPGESQYTIAVYQDDELTETPPKSWEDANNEYDKILDSLDYAEDKPGTITIEVESGVITAVRGLPDSYQYEILDHDMESEQ